MATGNGLILLNPSESIISNDAGIEGYQFFRFDNRDGLSRKEFFLTPALLDSKNRIWWGIVDGFMMLDLNEFELPDDTPANISLTHIGVNQHFVDFRALQDSSYRYQFAFGKHLSHSFDSVAAFFNYPVNLTLPHHLNHLTFHFSAIDWAAPHKIRYSYLIEGLDEKWSIPQPEPVADYRNLPHGPFTLKVRAIGAAQVWSEPFEYTFTIRPPWWFSWWAYVLYGLIIASLLYALYRFLLSRQLQLAEARRLLRNTDLNISEVAYDTGFSDPGYFSRVFRQEFGLSPTAFREDEG